ncbi:MAG TPA: rhomboid family intramembrane serine protease [Chlamydiales bacterium]|nr:rhomboid family intramembrane serine protease [Chlamydiales bacterium]
MRNIGSFPDQGQAKKFSQFLRSKGIENTCEISFNKQKNGVVCAVWVHDEDQKERAEKYYLEFCQNPDDPKFKIPESHQKASERISAIESPPHLREEVEERRPVFPVLYFFLAVCVVIFMIDTIQEMSVDKKNPTVASLVLTPLENALFIDAPIPISVYNRIIESHAPTSQDTPQQVQEDVKEMTADVDKIPYFRGFYQWILERGKGEKQPTGPMFIKVRQGEVWRLFTPAILHKNLLHILFNMLWLWVLGKQIELRVPRARICILILLVGIFTNVLQYLISGPYFLGFSGVVMGMAGFIWMRQRVAPWEGYPLSRTIFLFLALYIGALLLLQIASFFAQFFGLGAFSANIANTAHIAGAIIGALLGRMPFFSWRAVER